MLANVRHFPRAKNCSSTRLRAGRCPPRILPRKRTASPLTTLWRLTVIERRGAHADRDVARDRADRRRAGVAEADHAARPARDDVAEVPGAVGAQLGDRAPRGVGAVDARADLDRDADERVAARARSAGRSAARVDRRRAPDGARARCGPRGCRAALARAPSRTRVAIRSGSVSSAALPGRPVLASSAPGRRRSTRARARRSRRRRAPRRRSMASSPAPVTLRRDAAPDAASRGAAARPRRGRSATTSSLAVTCSRVGSSGLVGHDRDLGRRVVEAERELGRVGEIAVAGGVGERELEPPAARARERRDR